MLRSITRAPIGCIPGWAALTLELLVGSLSQSNHVQAGDDGTNIEQRWIRPASEGLAEPLWGHVDGIRVGLHPLGKLRGLLRVYAPYLGHGAERAINYIAIEPIVAGTSHRGYSELEYSAYDNMRGKRFWSTDQPVENSSTPVRPVPGEISWDENFELLRVYVQVEPFENGAHVYLRLTFRSDRPHEFGIASFVHDDSAVLSHCIITATMGNYARLRRLQLIDRFVTPSELWPDFTRHDFTEHARFVLKDLMRNAEGDAVVYAAPDETWPENAAYSPDVKSHWRYEGTTAVQGWRCEKPSPALEVWVNGRSVYWNSAAPIPGGIAYENFEMVEPFEQGREFWFSVVPERRNNTK